MNQDIYNMVRDSMGFMLEEEVLREGGAELAEKNEYLKKLQKLARAKRRKIEFL